MFSSQILRYVELNPRMERNESEYPFTIPAVRHLGRLALHPSVTFLVGENGSGKSTLIEAIAQRAGFDPAGGSKNLRSNHYPSESNLSDHLILVRGTRREKGGFFLRAETMYNVFTSIEEKGLGVMGWENLHEVSHGEAFLWVFLNRFKAKELYILDEPEAALSPQRQLSFVARLHQLVRSGSQFVISTHSPIVMAYPRSRIYELSADGVSEVSYEETEHFQVTRAFLHNPKRMLDRLMSDSDSG